MRPDVDLPHTDSPTNKPLKGTDNVDSGPRADLPVVMKFGGSSVADLERLRSVAALVANRAQQQPVVVVVSAMGKTTNGLVSQAQELCPDAPAREMDMLMSTGERHSMAMLALALHRLGRRAISLTGSQCGVITDHQHQRARVIEVRPFRILDELCHHDVVIVGGFQGVSYKREVTTLGRGGSDTSAVALAAALGADCEIYSDVDGVYSADPRIVAAAQPIAELGYDEMQALARAGAKVLHAQAVELARERGIAIYARSTNDPGGRQTIIRADATKTHGIAAVTCDAHVARVRVSLGNDTPRAAIAHLARASANLGLRHFQVDGHTLSGIVSLTQRDDEDQLQQQLGQIVQNCAERYELAIEGITWQAGLAELSCVGSGIDERPETLPELIDQLEIAEIDIHACFTRPNTVAVLLDHESATKAVQHLHAVFVES